MPVIRPMRAADASAAHDLAVHTFAVLDRGMGIEPEPPPPDASVRYSHCVETDPGGSWVAEEDGELTGCALAIRRDDVWGLSLLIVRPDRQSSGLGRALLAHAVDYGHGARGRIILSSPDPRALRTYSRIGLEAHPCLVATGYPQDVLQPPEVREGTREDLPFTEEVDRYVRGAAHGADIGVMLELGSTLLVAPDHGYAVTNGRGVRLLAAFDTHAAQDLLRAVLARMKGAATVTWLTARQQWAIDVCVEARLELGVTSGAVFVDGDVGPFTPYIPSGAFL